MDHIAQPTDYRLTPNTLSFALNILGEANRVQCSVSSGASIKCFIEDVTGLDYNSNHEYREWPVIVAPTYFNTDTIKYIYAAIPKTSASGTAAMIVFPSEQLDIYGKNAQNEQIGPTTHFFIWLQGIISAVTTTDDVSTRQITQLVNDGVLGTEQARAAKAITNIKVNGSDVQIEAGTAEITTPQQMSDLENDENFIEESDVSAGNNILQLRNKSLNLAHGHDWGNIVNKPNLVEGITAGNGKLSFFHSNGDTTVADFSSLIATINSKASQVSVDALVNQRGMVIDPLVWAATYNDDGFVWTETLIGNYWFDTTAGKLKIFVGFILDEPIFPEVKGMFLVWHESTGELVMYSWYGTGNPSTITIFTQ